MSRSPTHPLGKLTQDNDEQITCAVVSGGVRGRVAHHRLPRGEDRAGAVRAGDAQGAA